MQIPRRVLLDHEATASGLARAGGRLRRLGEIALLPIGGERRLGSDCRREINRARALNVAMRKLLHLSSVVQRGEHRSVPIFSRFRSSIESKQFPVNIIQRTLAASLLSERKVVKKRDEHTLVINQHRRNSPTLCRRIKQ